MGNKKMMYILLSFTVVLTIVMYLLLNKSPFTSNASDFGLGPSKPVASSKGYGVSASHPLAVKAGMDVLEKGGNAVDAAIAVSYALGVVEPYASGIGGGGEMVIYTPNKKPLAYEYREKAPLSGNKSSSIGVPGLVKGLETIHGELGTKKMADLIQPAIDLAEKGYKVDPLLTERLQAAAYRMPVDRISQFYPNGKPIQSGKALVQKELADTLKKIQKEGSLAFYNGQITGDILNKSSNLKQGDFTNYSISKNDPVYGEFAGYKVIAPPPPLAGITTIQSLQMAEKLAGNLKEDNAPTFVQVVNEICKVTYQDRLLNIGDPAFFNRPFGNLTSKEYTNQLSSKVSVTDISKQEKINDSAADEEDHSNTTHFVVVDKNGMMVSVTNTLSNFFGSGTYVDGFFLNSQLDNFSSTPGSPNLIEPGKKPRSYISPMILVNDNRVMGIGSPGGKRIPMVLAQVLIRNLILDEPIQDAINAPRFYVENKNLYTEKSFPTDILQELKKKGYDTYYRESSNFFGGVQAMVVDKKNNKVYGAADSRRNGYWQAAK